jgi:hypothetical protein
LLKSSGRFLDLENQQEVLNPERLVQAGLPSIWRLWCYFSWLFLLGKMDRLENKIIVMP